MKRQAVIALFIVISTGCVTTKSEDKCECVCNADDCHAECVCNDSSFELGPQIDVNPEGIG